jgi:hypothetical protein
MLRGEDVLTPLGEGTVRVEPRHRRAPRHQLLGGAVVEQEQALDHLVLVALDDPLGPANPGE